MVGPLSHSYAAAGFFPRSTQPTTSQSCSSIYDTNQQQDRDEYQEQESVYNQTKYWLIEDPPNGQSSKLNKQFLSCIQTMNLRNNFLYWDAKSKEKQKQQQISASSSIDKTND